MEDISGFGIRINLIASNTYPVGIMLTMFADDSDPLDVPAKTIAEVAMGLNGDLLGWSRANPDLMNFSLIPGSQDDLDMQTLMAANTVAKGRRPARDVITATVMYPDGRQVTKINGKLLQGPPQNSVASSGRMKSATYNCAFEDSQRG